MHKRISLLVAAAGIALPCLAFAAAPTDQLIKTADSSAVYYLASDAKRYVFPNEKTYASWFTHFGGVYTVPAEEMASYPLGGNVTYRPGIRMVKIQSDPKLYAVTRGGVLRWVASETVATQLYGQYWNQAVDDVPDSFFVNYSIGDPITGTDDFSPQLAAEQNDTINADKGIPVGFAPRVADSVVTDIIAVWRQLALEDVNRIRAQHGKAPLKLNALLNRIALIHSMDMALNIGQLSHDGSFRETADDRIRFGSVPDLDEGKLTTVPHPDNVDWTGENLGWATTGRTRDPLEAIYDLHEGFMDEPADEHNHRSNMLSTFTPYTEIGIGIFVDSEGGVWLTQDFISLQQ